MRRDLKRAFLVPALLAVLAFVAAPLFAATAFAADAQLYELTENMKLVGGKLVHRKATSELMGTANAGTPLCPLPVNCTINATGSDNINLATGLGNFGGTFTVVVHVQGENATDSPEYVIAKGKFHGKMDFSPAILAGVPLGTVVGKMVLDGGGGTVPFTGTFRLPFVLDKATVDKANPGDALYPLRQGLILFFGDDTPADANVAALLGWGSLPLTPFPTKFYTDQTDKCPTGIVSCTRPLYLGSDGSLLPVAAEEYGLGWPTVRFDITFLP